MKCSIRQKAAFFGTGSSQHRADAPSICFIHGAGFDHSVWVMPARYFARHGYNVVAPDLPGHGRTAGPALSTIAEMADWLLELLDTTEIQQSILVGHSMGTLIALHIAANHPQRVRRMALLGTSIPMPVGAALLAAAGDSDHAAIDMANTWSHAVSGELGVSAMPGTHNRVGGERWLERMRPEAYFADLNACNEFQIDPAKVAAPTLVIAGSADRMTPPAAGRLVAQRLRNGTLCLLPGCGHAMLSEQPNRVLDALAQFVLD
jgi:pimeloyl-ACP methyl ester carboxylesterase